jgi:glycine/D-amino acid oxidase-like deaminating enzyme
MDRRRFLGVTGAGALGLGASGLSAETGADPAGEGTGARPDTRPAAPAVHTGTSSEVLVIGAGVFGMFTAHYLRERGVDVRVVDQHGPGNSRATSGGETRGVRSSYGDRPHGNHWARWAVESMRRWKAWDERYSPASNPLFHTTGDLILRPEEEPYLRRTRANWDALGVEYEDLSMEEVARRWPVIRTEGMTRALYEPAAGVVRARAAIQSAAEQFRINGGQFTFARITPGDAAGGRLSGVVTDQGETLTADTYLFACGPWLPKVLPDVMGNRLRVRIMGHVFYFATPPGDHRWTVPNLPSYGVPGGTGWPAMGPDYRGFRARTGGRAHEDPDTSDRATIPPEGFERGIEFVRRFFPEIAEQPILETRACHYESSLDRNFIVDVHPGWENCWIAGGGSAEAFKQGPTLGDYIAHRILGQDMDPEVTEGFRLTEETFGNEDDLEDVEP